MLKRTLLMVFDTKLMAPETAPLMEFQTVSAIPRIPFQTPDQSPLMAASTTLITCWITDMTV